MDRVVGWHRTGEGLPQIRLLNAEVGHARNRSSAWKRGLLDRALVALASEFGRDMMTEGKPGAEVKAQVNQAEITTEPTHYGMQRDFTEACPVLVFGGGTHKGRLYGRTADKRPCRSSRTG